MPLDDPTPFLVRMRRVLAHIEAHLDDDLDVDRLAGVAAFSRFHFQRQFSALFGMTVSRYVQMLRLRRASYRLAFRPDDRVLGVALDSGYGSPEAFARAFQARFGNSPGAFRRAPSWDPWQVALGPLTAIRRRHMSMPLSRDDVEIVAFPETPVAIMRHRGDPARLPETIRAFIAWRRAAGLSPRESATFNILHGDPADGPPEAFVFDLCAGVRGAVEGPVAMGVIPGGRCARLRTRGYGENPEPGFALLLRDWLPASGERLRDAPLFVQRVSFYPDVPEGEAVTDLFIPLEG
jgi:AraC family transcriptional regulator